MVVQRQRTGRVDRQQPCVIQRQLGHLGRSNGDPEPKHLDTVPVGHLPYHVRLLLVRAFRPPFRLGLVPFLIVVLPTDVSLKARLELVQRLGSAARVAAPLRGVHLTA